MAGVVWAISRSITNMEGRIKSDLASLSDKFYELRGEVRARFRMQDSERVTIAISDEIAKLAKKANRD